MDQSVSDVELEHLAKYTGKLIENVKRNHGDDKKAPTYALTREQYETLFEKHNRASEEGIKKKINRTPERIADLLADIHIIHSATENDFTPYQTTEEFVESVEKTVGETTSLMGGTMYGTDRGYAFGLILGYLLQPDDKQDMIKCLAGFLMAFSEESDMSIDNMLYQFESEYPQLVRNHSEIQQWNKIQTDSIVRGQVDYHKQIEQKLEERGLPQTDTIIEYIRRNGDFVQKYGEPLEYTITHNKAAAETMLDRIDQEYGIETIQLLIDNICTDLSVLVNEEARGVSGLSVFRTVANNNDPISQARIDNRLSIESSAYLLKKFAGTHSQDNVENRWEYHPLIEKTHSGDWKTTQYGEFIDVVFRWSGHAGSERVDEEAVADELYNQLLHKKVPEEVFDQLVDSDNDSQSSTMLQSFIDYIPDSLTRD